MSEYWKLWKKVEAHPGFQYRMRRKAFFRSLSIFGGNFMELMSVINYVENPDKFIRMEPEKIDEAHNQILRTLHNYVSSAHSLVDHTRRYVNKWHANDEIRRQYENKIDVMFKQHLPSNTIKDLRNYIIHWGLPIHSILLTGDAKSIMPPKIRIQLDVAELLKWDNWSIKSRQYLSMQGSDIELKSLIGAYQNQVKAFYLWFDNLLESYHSEEIKEMDELSKRVIELEDAMHKR